MSYEKLGLTNGTVLTAEHLNHMEDGIANAGGGGGGGFVVNFSLSEDMSLTSDKTVAEVKQAYLNGDNILAYFDVQTEKISLSTNFSETAQLITFNGISSVYEDGVPFITINGFMLITVVGDFMTGNWAWSMANGQVTDVLAQG